MTDAIADMIAAMDNGTFDPEDYVERVTDQDYRLEPLEIGDDK